MKIKDLPNEILILIFSYLDLSSNYEVSNTCLLFKKIYIDIKTQHLYSYNEKEWIIFINYVKKQIKYNIQKVQNNETPKINDDKELFVIVSDYINIIDFINNEVKTFINLYDLIRYIELFNFKNIVLYTYRISKRLNYIKLYKTSKI